MATYTGTTGADTHIGTSGNDSISGLGGDDVLNGGAGADTVNGGSGNDRLNGGTGNDTIIGGVGTDTAVYAHMAANGDAPVASWSPTGVLTITTVADGTDTLNSVEFVEFAGVTFTVNNTARNIVARVIDDTVSGGENDASIAGNVLGNDVDLDSVLTVSGLVGGSLGVAKVGAHGSLTLNANGSFSYVPNGTSSGADTFTYQVTEAGGTRTAVLTVNVADVNDAPVAVDASTTILEDAPFTGSVAGDASDEESTSFTFATVTPPASAASFTLNPDGTFNYTPAANFHGADSFTYRITDGGGQTDTATFTFTVTSVNDAPVAEDVSIGGNLEDSAGVTVSVQLNSSDVDNDTRVVTHINGQAIAAGETVNVTNGTVTLLMGDLVVTPALNFVGNVTFSYTVSDGALSDDGQMSIGFVNVNDGPVADDASQSGLEDNAITGTLTGSDIDGDSLTFAPVADPAHGSVVINANGTFTYTPNADYNGPDSFTFKVLDGNGGSSIGVYSLTVTAANDGPTAAPVSQSFNEDVATVIDIQGASDDVDGDSLTVTLIDGEALTEEGVAVTGGVVTLTSGGNLLFTPTPDYNGAVSFEYTVSDGTLTATSTVDLTVAAVDDAPRAADFTLSTAEDSLTPTLIDLPSVDVDGQAITVSIGGNDLTVGETVAVAGGSVTFNVDGDLEFTPGLNFNGTVDFDYTLTSGFVAEGPPVVITPGDPGDPGEPADAGWGAFDRAEDLDFITETLGFYTWDGSAITLSGFDGQSYAELQEFTGSALSAFDQSFTARAVKFVLNVDAGDVITMDYTFTGDDLDLLAFFRPGGLGSDLTVDASGVFTYTATANGPVTLVFAAMDRTPGDGSQEPTLVTLDNLRINGEIWGATEGVEPIPPTEPVYGPGDPGSPGLSDTAHVTINVAAVNDAPTAAPISQSAGEDVVGGVVIDVQAASDDVDEDNLTVSFINGEALTEDGVAVTGGLVTLTTGGNLLFTPAPDYNGAPSFSYTVTDGTLEAISNVNLTITAVDDAPRAEDFTGSTTEDEVAPTVIALPTVDVDGEAITVSIDGVDLVLGEPVTVFGGTVVLNEDGDLEFTPGLDFNGDASFDYTLTSGATAGVTTSWGALDNFADVTEIALLGSFSYGWFDGDGELVFNGQPGVSNAELTAFVGRDGEFNENFTWSAAKVVVQLEAGEEFTVEYTTTGDGVENYFFNFINGNGPDFISSGNTAGVFRYTAAVGGNYTFVFASGDLASGGAVSIAKLDNLAIDGVPLSVSTGTAGLSDTATVTIEVSAVNDQPTAEDLNLFMDEDQDGGLVIDLPGAGSDVDTGTVFTIATINGEPIGVDGVEILGGTLTLITEGDNAGQLLFTPTLDYNQSVSFEYTLSDGSGLSNGQTLTHTVDIDITNINDEPLAADGSATLDEDGSYDGDVSPLASDIESETLSFSVFSGPSNGEVVMQEDGAFTYTPDPDFFGEDSFEYLVDDGEGGQTVGTFTFTVTGFNDAPTAANLELGLLEDQDGGLVIDLLGPGSDVDGDEDTLSVSTINGVAFDAINGVDILGGRLTLITEGDNAGNLLFTPDADYAQDPSFTYTLTDGELESNEASVDIDITPVNDAPVAPDFDRTIAEDVAPIIFDLAEFDVDGDALTVSIGGNALELGDTVSVTGGTVTLLAGNDLQFTADANFNGAVDFDYTLSDNASVGRTDFENYPVGFETVGGAVSEEGPTGDRVRLSGNGATMQEVFDFVGNSSFVDIHALQPGQPYGPGISGSAMKFDIVWDYTKDVTFELVADGIGDNEDVYQVLVVDSAGIMRALITNRTSSGDNGTFNTGNFSFNNGLNDGEAYTFAIVLVNRQNAETMGSMTVDNLRQGGELLGTPGASTTGSVHIDVTPVNDDVIAEAINDLSVAEDGGGLTIPVFSGPNVDSGETLTIASINGDAFTGEPVAITGGVLSLVEGQLVFTPGADFNGPVSFSYSLTDGTFTSDEAEVSITVTPVNDDPVAEDGSGTAVEDTLYEGELAGLASDIDSRGLSYSLASDASNGTVLIDEITGEFTYQPDLNFEGRDSFQYTVSDGAGGSTTATFELTVTGVNDAPTAVSLQYEIVEDDAEGVVVRILDGAVDPDTGDLLAVARINGVVFDTVNGADVVGGHLSLITTGDDAGNLLFVAEPDYDAAVSFEYTLTDGEIESETATVDIEVTPVNDAPRAVDFDETMDEDDGSITIDLAEFDVDGEALTVSIGGAVLALGDTALVTGGTVTLLAGNDLKFAPSANFNGEVDFDYVLSDPGTGTPGFTGDFSNGLAGLNLFGSAVIGGRPTDANNPALVFHAADSSAADLNVLAVTDGAFGTNTYYGAAGGAVGVQFSYTPNVDGVLSVSIDVEQGGDADIIWLVATDQSGGPVHYTGYYTDNDLTANFLTAYLSGGRTYTITLALVEYNGDSGQPTVHVDNVTFDGFILDLGSSSAPLTDTGHIHIDVAPVNDPVVAQPFELSMQEDGGGLVIPVTFVLNVDSEIMSVATVDGTAFTGTRNIDGGVLTLNVDGNLVFTPDLNFEGAASFTYSLTDGEFTSDEESVDILVNPVNDAPTLAAEPNRSTDEDTIITGQAATPVDVDGEDTLSYVVLTSVNGLIFNTETGAWTFDPTNVAGYQALQVGQTQTVSFTYAAFDGVEQSNAVTVQIAIAGRADAVNGTAGGDGLAGSQFVDIINGLDGDDAISGMDGDDILSGGNGDDVLGAGLGNDQLTGGDGDDTLSGDKGNDILAGGLGDDFLIGGNGNDTATYAAATGPVNANLATGTATGEGSDFLVQMENLTGSAFDDILTGSSTNNLLDGGDGNDLIDGGNGIDTIHGGNGSDSLYGGALGDFLFGGDGNDFLVGGLNSDTMTGGLGADTFIVLQESIAGTIETDIILDFNQAEGDILDVSGIDANSTMVGDQSFAFVSSHTSNAAGQMTASFAAGVTVLRFYTNADNVVDYQIRVTGDHTLDHVITAGDPVGTGGWLL